MSFLKLIWMISKIYFKGKEVDRKRKKKNLWGMGHADRT